MPSTAELYLAWLTECFGEEAVIRQMNAPDGGPPVAVFFYRDLPEEGMLTAVTYGLSEESTCGTELMVTLSTDDEAWGMAVAYFAAQFRGKKDFSYQSLFTLDTPIAAGSEMAGFFVFAPAILDPQDAVLELPDRTIYLKGMYPIYPEEVALLQRQGLERFWKHPDYDMYDVRRPNLGR